MCLAVPGRLVSRRGTDGLTGVVDFEGVLKEVNLSCVPDVQVGEYVVVHLGLAIDRLDEQQALEEIADLKRLGSAG